MKKKTELALTKDCQITKGWWMTENVGGQLWHYKNGPRSMTKLYRTKAHMIAENPELTEAVGGTMFFANAAAKPHRRGAKK